MSARRHYFTASFEYYIELLFLAKAPENWKQRELDTKMEQQKIINAIKNSEDPCLVKLKVDDRFQPRKEELEEVLEGHRKNSLYKLCYNTGLVWMYDAVYRSLSSDAHPSIVRYSNRYFKVDPSGEMREYYSAPQLDEEEAINRLVLLSDILIGSTKCIHQILPNCNNSAIEAHLQKFELEMVKAKVKRAN